MDTQRNALSEDEIIHGARMLRGEHEVSTVLEACEAFYGHGFSDESDGDVETFGHFYRVHRWIVWTDNQGFHGLETYDTEAQAQAYFATTQLEYAATMDTDYV